MLADVPPAELGTDELHARNAWAQVYVVRSHEPDSTTGAPRESVSEDHRNYLRRLESAGLLYAHGPVEILAGDSLRELAIIAAASAEDAGRIAMGDPLHQAGHRTKTVQSHIINEGVACYVAREMSRRALAAPETSSVVPDAQAEDGAPVEAGPGVELYLISLDPTDKPRLGDAADADHAHFVWLRENEMAARLMSCGPIGPSSRLVPGSGSVASGSSPPRETGRSGSLRASQAVAPAVARCRCAAGPSARGWPRRSHARCTLSTPFRLQPGDPSRGSRRISLCGQRCPASG